MKMWTALLLGLVLLGYAPGALAKSLAMTHTPKAVKAYVAAELRADLFPNKDDTTYPARIAAAPLPSGRGHPTYVVLVTGRDWCGATGNCTIMVIEATGHGFRTIGDASGHEPIHLLAASTHAHRDLAISVHGSAWDNYDFRWRFNGSTYVGGEPLNGYVLDTARQSKTGEQESRKLPYKPEGPLLIGSEDKGELLFAN